MASAQYNPTYIFPIHFKCFPPEMWRHFEEERSKLEVILWKFDFDVYFVYDEYANAAPEAKGVVFIRAHIESANFNEMISSSPNFMKITMLSLALFPNFFDFLVFFQKPAFGQNP